ncbi:hypothetical protein [Comamonas testosteroni]|uniref:hypothetical protein n=1 Tax=Comamonas testosteroni TaxID=285 RepID=UPI002E14B3F4|nr:hypothetical protein U0024_21860 [Comamonas testosteroni]
MASYDKAKMMRLLEAKRAIHLTSNDFYHHLRELREHIGGKRTVMRSNANMYESRDQVESMLDMTELRASLPFDRGFKDSFGSPFFIECLSKTDARIHFT